MFTLRKGRLKYPLPFFLEMRFMIFNDKQNSDFAFGRLNQGRSEEKKRYFDNDRTHRFLVEKIAEVIGVAKENTTLVRSYVYTGAYTSKVVHDINKACGKNIKQLNEFIEREQKLLDDISKYEIDEKIRTRIKEHVDNIKTIYESRKESEMNQLEKQKRNSDGQRRFLTKQSKVPFLEVRTTPLKQRDGKPFQKGVDVKLAVDLVHFAHCNAYDVAIIMSGDTDLLESVSLVRKILGKTVILVSFYDEDKPEYSIVSKELIGNADFFFNTRSITEKELLQFTDEMRHKQKS